VGARGGVWITAGLVCADDGTDRWEERGGVGALSGPREYEHCFTLQGPRGEFVQLTPTIGEHVARAVEWARGRNKATKRAKLYEREAREERAYEEWAVAVMDDGAPAMGGAPMVAVG